MVSDILYGEGQITNDIPYYIFAKWKDYIGPPFFENDDLMGKWNPMSAYKLLPDNYKYHRKQFLLRLAYAMKIHINRGQTLDRALVNLGIK